jgi:hypothetical protein
MSALALPGSNQLCGAPREPRARRNGDEGSAELPDQSVGELERLDTGPNAALRQACGTKVFRVGWRPRAPTLRTGPSVGPAFRSKTVEHDSYLLLHRELPPRSPPDLPYGRLTRLLVHSWHQPIGITFGITPRSREPARRLTPWRRRRDSRLLAHRHDDSESP